MYSIIKCGITHMSTSIIHYKYLFRNSPYDRIRLMGRIGPYLYLPMSFYGYTRWYRCLEFFIAVFNTQNKTLYMALDICYLNFTD